MNKDKNLFENNLDFAERNKGYFTKNCDWEILLNEISKVIKFFDNLEFLTYGRDMAFVRTDKGGSRMQTNHEILNSVTQTLRSINTCASYGSIADTYMLVRKYRDDLFFYLYLLVSCDTENLFNTGYLSKQEKAVNAWHNNELSDLNISEVLKCIACYPRCKEAVIKFDLKNEFTKISSTLNNYTHGNGKRFYNKLYSQYRGNEIKELASDLNNIINYTAITFVFLLIIVLPNAIRSTDYIDALDSSMAPEAESQYWVAPFVFDFVENNKSLLGLEAVEYLRQTTDMQI